MSFCLFYFSAQITFRSLFNLFIQPHRCLLWVDKRFSSTYVLNKSSRGRVMFFCSVWWHRVAGGPELFGTSCLSQAQVWVEIPIEPQAFHPTHGGGKYSPVLPAWLLPPLQPSKGRQGRIWRQYWVDLCGHGWSTRCSISECNSFNQEVILFYSSVWLWEPDGTRTCFTGNMKKT